MFVLSSEENAEVVLEVDASSKLFVEGELLSSSSSEKTSEKPSPDIISKSLEASSSGDSEGASIFFSGYLRGPI